MRAAIYTLGCKVNQYETQAMEQELRRRGHELVDFEDSADAYIINTCSVTAVSDKKSRQMIRRARRRSPGAVVAACGCYVQTHTDEAKTLGIDLIGGTGDRMAFLDLLEQEVRDRTPRVAVDDSLRRRSFEVLPAGGLAARTRAMLKVEDGCVNFCTYCIIPFARGPVRSLPMDQAVAQTRQLQAEGYRELVFTGIEISSDGMVLLPTIREIVKDYEDLNFAVSELHGVQSGTLRLGCFTSLAISLLPEILKDFHQTYPNIQIQLMTGEYYEISEWLRRGAIDCGFLAIPASNDFETTPILHDTMVAILPKDHPMADASVFPLEQLPHENFVRLMEIEDYEFNRLLDHYNIHPEVTYDTTSDFALLSMVEAGLGISIVHSLLIKPGRYRVAVLPLNVKQSREIGIAVKKGFLPSTITQLFLQHVVDYTRDMGEITVIRH
jgi:DNA-binding transcriptional LysR family regulator